MNLADDDNIKTIAESSISKVYDKLKRNCNTIGDMKEAIQSVIFNMPFDTDENLKRYLRNCLLNIFEKEINEISFSKNDDMEKMTKKSLELARSILKDFHEEQALAILELVKVLIKADEY